MGYIYGADLSHHNHPVTVETTKGMDFCILKALQGMGYTDDKVLEYVPIIANQGIPYGVYIYSEAVTISEAQAEAQRLINFVKANNLKPFALFIDIEKGNQLGAFTSLARSFCDYVNSQGYKSGVYASFNFWRNNGFPGIWGYRWIARYYNQEEEPMRSEYLDNRNFDIYQYTNSHNRNGMICDYNVAKDTMLNADAGNINWKPANNNQGKWIQSENGLWWFKHQDGTYTTNNWESINGEWYYFNDQGYALVNDWLNKDNKWYYFDENCKMVHDTYRDIIGKDGKEHRYYFGPKGDVVTGWCKTPTSYIYATENGIYRDGFYKVTDSGGTYWYYFKKNGEIVRNASIYADKQGHILTESITEYTEEKPTEKPQEKPTEK